jgi:hypothetical protein
MDFVSIAREVSQCWLFETTVLCICESVFMQPQDSTIQFVLRPKRLELYLFTFFLILFLEQP